MPAVHNAGPKYSLEAAEYTRVPLPSGIEAPSDPTGVDALQQTYAAARTGGYVRTAVVLEYTPREMKDALQASADCSVISAVIDFT